MQNVDVDAVLSQLASRKGGGGNWRTSIVDLLKLLDLDSSRFYAQHPGLVQNLGSAALAIAMSRMASRRGH